MTGTIAASTRHQTDLSLRHLQAELARIDLLVSQEVVRWRLAGRDPEDRFRGLHISEDQIEQLLAHPLGMSGGQAVALDPQDAEALAAAQADAERRVQEVIERAHREGQITRLEHLVTAFGLDHFDLDTVLICLAPALDLRYERLYAYLQDDVTRKKPTVSLVLDLLSKPIAGERLPGLLRFTDEAPLLRHDILQVSSDPGPLLGQTLIVDRAVVSWLLGGYEPHAQLARHAALHPPQLLEIDRLLVGEALSGLESALCAGSCLAVFYGADEVRQEASGRLLAALAGRSLLRINLAGVVASGIPPLRALQLALRDARLVDAIPYLSGWDVCLPTTEAGTTEAASPCFSDLLTELCTYPGLAIVAGRRPWHAGGIERESHILWLEFSAPNYAQRRQLWEHYVSSSAIRPFPVKGGKGSPVSHPGCRIGAEGLSALAGQFALTAGQIRDAVVAARDIALRRGDEVRIDDLLTAARTHVNPRLVSLARKITPRYTWSDIVLPDDQLALLHEIIDTVRGRPRVLEEWGLGQKLASSSGITILFSGPPGTGKTMAAEVMAAELGLDLYKIDLSTVVSKYIGETEKNLERIFNEAQASNAILFFDEADAIFGKRSEVKDAHDRYANIEISYLLQRMEAYEGVTILATNLRANLDEAFTRRLQFAVDLPFPDEPYRLRIWQTLFPPSVPRDADLDFELLARRFKLAGGNIRNILVSAAYLAAADGGRLTMKHLLHGTRRELQKMGRLVSEQDHLLLGGTDGG